MLFATLLVIYLVPKPIPLTVAGDVLTLCLEGINEKRDLNKLLSARSLNVSRILRNELLDLQSQTEGKTALPEVLASRTFALDILSDLGVPDIRPICAFLRELDVEDHWRTLVALGGSLEKSTHGRLLSGLKDEEVAVFRPILKQGLAQFETDGTFLIFLIDHCHPSKGDVNSSSSFY